MSFSDITRTQRGRLASSEEEREGRGMGVGEANPFLDAGEEAGGGAGGRPRPRSGSFADVGTPSSKEEQATLKEACERAVFQLTTRVAAYKRMVGLLGTRKDTQTHRKNLREVGEDVSILLKKTTQNLKQVQPKGKRSKTRHQKLLKDFQTVLTEFQASQRLCHEKRKQSDPVNTPVKRSKSGKAGRGGQGRSLQFGTGTDGDYIDTGNGEHDEHRRLLQEERRRENELRQEQVAIEGELEHNNVLIEEREQDIRDIQFQIGEVTEIFQDLAVLVHEQGDVVDDIEANIVQTYDKTSSAKEELKKAAQHQKSARLSLCIILLMAIGGLVVLMLVLNVFNTK